jgi:hypothetical protein
MLCSELNYYYDHSLCHSLLHSVILFGIVRVSSLSAVVPIMQMKPTPAPPLAEGDASAQGLLFEDAYLNAGL